MTELQVEIHTSGSFYTLLLVLDRSKRKKKNHTDIANLDHNVNKLESKGKYGLQYGS